MWETAAIGHNKVCTHDLPLCIYVLTFNSEKIHTYSEINSKLSIELGRTCYTSCFPSHQLSDCERAIRSASNYQSGKVLIDGIYKLGAWNRVDKNTIKRPFSLRTLT